MGCGCRGGSPADDGSRDGLHGPIPFSLLVMSFRLRYLLNLSLSFSFCQTKTMATKSCDKQIVWCLQSISLDYFNNSHHHYFWNQTSERQWSLPERGLKYQTAPAIKRADSETQFHASGGVIPHIMKKQVSKRQRCTPPIQARLDTVHLRESQLPQEKGTRLSQTQMPILRPSATWAPKSLATYWRVPPWTSDIMQVQVVTWTQRNWLQIRRPHNPSLGLANLPDQCIHRAQRNILLALLFSH